MIIHMRKGFTHDKVLSELFPVLSKKYELLKAFGKRYTRMRLAVQNRKLVT